jgi:hypothetical protein
LIANRLQVQWRNPYLFVINLDGEPLVELKMARGTPTVAAILATAGNWNHLSAVSGCRHRR